MLQKYCYKKWDMVVNKKKKRKRLGHHKFYILKDRLQRNKQIIRSYRLEANYYHFNLIKLDFIISILYVDINADICWNQIKLLARASH